MKVVLLLVCIVLSLGAAVRADANEDQYSILTELYESTSGEMWKNNSKWLVRANSTSLCDWYGVSCAGKWVQQLNLKQNGLGGPLPDKWERLPYLERIDFSGNKILGTIPASIGNLTLDSLILSGNSFKGTIPSTLGNIGARLLYLDNNHLTGTLPESLARNPMQGLTLDLNQLSGTISSKFGDIGSQFLVISGQFNSFSGVLPSGLCKANACNFQYNTYLGCPSSSCRCALQSCNCGGIVCYNNSDCANGSCPTCSMGPWGYKTCGGK